MTSQTRSRKWFVPGDLNGFFGLVVDNLSILGFIAAALIGIFQFPAEVVFTLRAPAAPGTYPLAAAYWYGTEKATLLGYTTNALGQKEVRGGVAGGSGRVMFSKLQQIQVR